MPKGTKNKFWVAKPEGPFSVAKGDNCPVINRLPTQGRKLLRVGIVGQSHAASGRCDFAEKAFDLRA